MSLILIEVQDAIGTIVMNHLQKHNALSGALIAEITTALDSFRAQNIRAVVLRAPAGVKVWSAGHDVSELPEGGRDPLGWNDPLRVLVRVSPRPLVLAQAVEPVVGGRAWVQVEEVEVGHSSYWYQ